jgi:cytochrome b6
LKKRRDDVSLESLRAGAGSWLGERVEWQPLLAWLAKKSVPIHRWSWLYLLGGAALFLLGLQVATGCLLMLYYQPAETTAYESVREIMTRVPYGWLVRSMHAWGATLFIATAGLHFLSVLFTRAYRKPRELTWISGVLMFFLALGFGFSGYLLPWNELSYSATKVGTAIPEALPGVGEFITHFLRGGDQVTGATITRFFAVHVAFLPLGLGALLAIHLLLIQFQGMSLPLGMPDEAVRDRRPFFSEFMLLDFCAWLLLLGLIATLAVFLPAEMGVKADVLKSAPEGIKPEWYFLFMYKTLKLVPEALGVALFTLGAIFFLVLPLLDRNASRERKSPRFTAVFLVVLLCAATLEALAWLDPGVPHSAEPLAAETYSITANSVTLLLFWAVIGFLLFYLLRLFRENGRIRHLYPEDGQREPSALTNLRSVPGEG